MVFITAINLTPPGSAHQHIAKVRWLDTANSTSNTMTVAQAVDFLRKGNPLQVADAKGAVAVQVVDATPPHIRTIADQRYTDNLLALPTF